MNKITKYIILYATFFFIFSLARGQDIIFKNVNFIHGNGIDKVADIHFDKENNLYIVGTFEKNMNIAGTEMQKRAHRNLFLAKYNSVGTLLFTKQFGGNGKINAHSLISDSHGNLFVSGTFRISCRFGKKELKTDAWQSNFILKLSPNGAVLQLKKIEADTKDIKTFLRCDKNDCIYYAGTYYNKLKIDQKEIESTSGSDIFIAKLKNNLDLINLHTIHGKNKDILNAVAFSEDNRLFIAGSFTDNIDFNGKQFFSEGRKDIFLAEANINSENKNSEYIKQVTQIGGYYNDFPEDILIKNNQLYLIGNFSGTVLFGKKKLVSKGMTDVFFSRFNLNLKEIKTQSFGGRSDDYAQSIVMSTKGNIYITGSFRGDIATGKKTVKTNKYQTDNFIAVFDSKGKLRTIESFGGKDNDFPVRTVINKQNVLYHTGTYRTDFKFGNIKTIETDKTKNNVFLAELYDCDNTTLNLGENIQVCGNSYTFNPNIKNYVNYRWNNGSNQKNITLTESGTYSLTVTDRFGCSASDNITITLNEIPTVDLGEDLLCKQGKIITLDAGSGFESYYWSSADSLQNIKTSKQQLIVNTENLPEGTYSYSVTATDYNGCSCNDKIQLTVKKPSVLTVFSAEIVPNPNNGKFTLYLTNADTKNTIIYEIYSPDGKLILKKEAESLKEEINLQTKAEGSYILKIINGTSVLNKVIIVSEK